jgi:hypothetical protein
MKKKHVLGLAFAGIIGSATLVACNKNDSDPQPLPEKVQKLVKANWKIVDITVPSLETAGEDSSLLKPCMADDIISFTTTGYDFQDGTNKCDSTIFPYAKNAWNYNTVNDSLLLGTSVANKVVRWKVATITDSTLRINWLDSISPTNKQVKTIKFKH